MARWVYLPLLAMTTVNNILPPIAVAWYCIQGHRICARSIGDNDALALVKASGAKGAGIGFGNSEIGSSGYGILPYMSAYRENRVYLDISTLENDVEIKNTSEITVPRSGSVVLVDFVTDEGRSLILELKRTDNGFIPLGADVLNEKMNQLAP